MKTSPTIAIRTATSADEAAIVALLPQLADFTVPPNRNPTDLWQGDVDLAQKILSGQTADAFIHVACDADQILGLIMVTMRQELMSHAPSAHLEAIVVHPDARGIGLGRRMLHHTEAEVRRRGAGSLTLHVFSNNRRALSLYEAEGFDSELVRAIKWL